MQLLSYQRKLDCKPTIESVKTTSMENASTGVLDKNKEHYLRCKDKAKNHMMYQGIYNGICQYTKTWRLAVHYVKPAGQLLFKSRFPKKVDRHTPNAITIISFKARNSPAKYLSWVSRCDIKGSDGTMLNPIFRKNFLGGERLQNAKYLVSQCCLKQIPMVTGILVFVYLS